MSIGTKVRLVRFALHTPDESARRPSFSIHIPIESAIDHCQTSHGLRSAVLPDLRLHFGGHIDRCAPLFEMKKNDEENVYSHQLHNHFLDQLLHGASTDTSAIFMSSFNWSSF